MPTVDILAQPILFTAWMVQTRAMTTVTENPWCDDLLGRRSDAADLLQYILSSYRCGAFTGEERSQVIAVDAEYGIGKTFFMKRFAQQISGKYPVAYIDAWSDDFIGDPIVSLTATLRSAFQDSLNGDHASTSWRNFKSKAGKIAWIGTKGLGKQGLKLLISGGAVHGIEAVLNNVDDQIIDDSKKAIEGALDDVTDVDLEKLSNDKARGYLDARISEYQDAKDSVAYLRMYLSQLAHFQKEAGKELPVFIFVDELDRCRPSYAIKFLEEVKHIFNVREIYFIISINSKQFSHSISHEYGANFNGEKYLNRFIDRTFQLKFPKMEKIVEAIFPVAVKGQEGDIRFIDSRIGDDQKIVSHTVWISHLLTRYGITPRGVFRFFDRLRTALALISHRPVAINYLCELIAKDICEIENVEPANWHFYIPAIFGSSGEWYTGDQLFNSMHNIFGSGPRELRRKLHSESTLSEFISDFVDSSMAGGAESYPSILRRVARFVDLEADASEA